MTMSTTPEIDTSDFYAFEHMLADDERAVLCSVRDFMTSEVEPIVNAHWERATFPFDDVLASHALCGQASLQRPRVHGELVGDDLGAALAGGQ